ncbi:MAG TPA: ATP-binding domain-containing protein [Conexibacter sp.]|jgi:superfamily I DNA/RNA helicase|nr:ATP-binding domain-containing protein [Conexibacter sp.]
MRLPTYQELTPEQDAVLMLPLDRRWLVTGPPGSGKSVLALFRAQATVGRELEPVLLMYNKLLARYSEQGLGQLGVDVPVHTFHSWWWRFFREQWQQAPPGQDWEYDWQEITHLQLASPAARSPDLVLLIDEAQDLPAQFFLFARLLFGGLTVFADENQRINDENCTLDEIREMLRPDDERRLTENHRNTREIAEVAAHFYAGAETGIPALPDREGPRPEVHLHASLQEAVERIANLATTARHRQIGVFVPTTRLVDEYVRGLEARDVPVAGYHSGRDIELLDFGRPGVIVTTWASAKGLEFDMVFIAEMQASRGDVESVELRMRLYVLCSRARRELYFSWTGRGVPTIAGLLPSWCREAVA